MKPRFLLPLQDLLPLAIEWAAEQEERILQSGTALDSAAMLNAHLAGVKHPEKVRICVVPFIPTAENAILKQANEMIGLVSPLTSGITFGYGIYIRDDLVGDQALLTHESVHVAQYERFGSIGNFLALYLSECLTIGYPNGPLEQEAVIRTKEIHA